MVAHACHPENFVFGICVKKKQKNVSKTKIIFAFVSQTLSLRKYFLNKSIFVSKKNYFHFGNTHFCLQIKIFSFQKQKQFCFRFEDTFISQMFSK